MLRNTFRYLASSESLRSLGVIGGSAMQQQQQQAEPIGVDRKPFTSESIARSLKSAPFKDPLWVTEGQLGALRIRPRPGEVPVVAQKRHANAKYASSYSATSGHIRLYNVEQLENPAALRDMPPQWIDDEPIYGLDCVALAKHQPPAGFGSPDNTRWFTFPDGLKRAERRALPNAKIISFVQGFGPSRRGVSLISEGHSVPADNAAEAAAPSAPASTNPTPTNGDMSSHAAAVEANTKDTRELSSAASAFPDDAEAQARHSVEGYSPAEEADMDGAAFQVDASADPAVAGEQLQPLIFHTTGNGTLFGNASQNHLRHIAKAHGYKSTTWHRVTTGNRHRFKPSAVTHTLKDKSDKFTSNHLYINGDDYSGFSANEQVSGRSGAPFRYATAQVLQRAAKEAGFTSNIWVTDQYVARIQCTVKAGEVPTPVSLGNRVSRFFNFDQLIDPPEAGGYIGAAANAAANPDRHGDDDHDDDM